VNAPSETHATRSKIGPATPRGLGRRYHTIHTSQSRCPLLAPSGEPTTDLCGNQTRSHHHPHRREAMEGAAAAAHQGIAAPDAGLASPQQPPQQINATTTPRLPLAPGTAATVASADGSGGGRGTEGRRRLAALGFAQASPWGTTRGDSETFSP
jgi:hypothetical protein